MPLNLDFLNNIDALTWGVIVINLLLILFAKPLVSLVFSDSDQASRSNRRLHIFRALNLLIIAAFGYYQFFKSDEQRALGLNILAIVVILYLAYLLGHLANYFILRRYGKTKEINGKTRKVETYNARILTLFSQVFIFIMALISIIRVLGFNSLLEAGGVIGVIGVFLALTQATWAPDIFSGLIILNSDMLEEGDVIELRGSEAIYGVVYKTKVFHTEVLNLFNNHRIMIRNALLRDQIIHNLSKFASAKGLRERLTFNIGYDASPAAVEKMLTTAWQTAIEQNIPGIQAQHEVEVGILNTGDHAVEWAVFYHTKHIEQLRLTRMALNRVFLKTAREHDISLATPLTHVIDASTVKQVMANGE
ncbi:MAG: mechanosensitive ion channel family protein [Arenicellales bacterium]